MIETKHTYSKVSRRMWNDATFRSLGGAKPNGQSLWLRLLTGPELTNIPGVVLAWEAGLAQALRWDLDGFRDAFRDVFEHGLAKADWDTGLVWVPNAIRHNPPQSLNVVVSWSKTWDLVPECHLKVECYHGLKAFMEGMPKAFHDAFEKGMPYPRAGARALTGSGEGELSAYAGASAPPPPEPSDETPRANVRPSGARRVRGTRLSPDWEPSPGTIERFRRKERVDATASVERFKNHWLSEGTKGAIKINWDLAFTNWVLEDIRRGISAPIDEEPSQTRLIEIHHGVRREVGNG